MLPSAGIRRSAPLAFITTPVLTLVMGSQAADYNVIDLGTLAGPTETTSPGSSAIDIADNGEVCGLSIDSTAEHNLRALLWHEGAMVDLDVLGFDVHSMAFALNNAGVSVGITFTLGDTTTQAVRWIGGSAAGLGTWAARDVNLAGHIVGEAPATSSGAFSHAVLWINGAMTDLGTLGGLHSTACAVNDADWITGVSFTAGNTQRRAFLWRNGAMTDLGTLGGAHSHAYDLSNTGYVVGMSHNAQGKSHAFRYELGSQGQVLTRLDLGELGASFSQASGVNDQGDVVGTSDDRAFLWTDDPAAMLDLNTKIPPASGWHLSHATAINNNGAIVGRGVHDGLLRGFLLAPSGIIGDLNSDGVVDGIDLGILLSQWFNPGTADLNGDGQVNGIDLGILLANWTL